jgi:hypothetical protein
MTDVAQLLVEEKGRLFVPGAVQNRLRLEPGMALVVKDGDLGGVRLGLEPAPSTLVDKQGILIVRAEAVADLDAVRARGIGALNTPGARLPVRILLATSVLVAAVVEGHLAR